MVYRTLVKGIKSIFSKLGNTKLLHRILIYNFLLIFLPIGLFMNFSYNKVNSLFDYLIKYSAEKSFLQTGAYLSKNVDYMEYIRDTFITNQKLNTILASLHGSEDVIQNMADYKYIEEIIQQNLKKNDIYTIRFYTRDSEMYINDVDYFSLQEAKKTKWYHYMKGDGNNTCFQKFDNSKLFQANQDTFSFVQSVFDLNNYSEEIALLRIDLKSSDLELLLRQTLTTRNSINYILGVDDSILASSSEPIKPGWLLNYRTIQDITGTDEYRFIDYELNNTKVLLGLRKLAGERLALVNIIPYGEIMGDLTKIRNEILLFVLALTAIAYLVAYFFVASTVKRIKLLTQNMKLIQKGEFGKTIKTNNKDEIGELTHDFNYMSEKLSNLVDERFKLGQEMKSFELKALQSQINPHFLYNTLDLINWTAMDNNVPEISKLVKALSRFYKISLNKGSDIIPIREELEHVKIFLDIQKSRFEDSMQVYYDIDEKVYEYSVLKIILQPIAENAVLHGILGKPAKKGVIRISAYCEGETIVFEIKDDGVGMDNNVLDAVTSVHPKRSKGYGAGNVNERIKIFYGEQYGLTYTSTPGEGTEVRIIIPAIPNEQP